MFGLIGELGREGADGDEAVSCPDCGDSLSLHLPDPEGPELMLLGVCEGCHAWYLLDEYRHFLGAIDVHTGHVAEFRLLPGEY